MSKNPPKADTYSLTQPILVVDCGGAVLSVAIYTPATGAYTELVEPQQKGGERLHLAIQELLEQAKTTPAALGAVGFAAGPGSFTGLRVAAAAAEGMALALNIPVVGVPTLPLIGVPYVGEKPVVVWNEAHGGMVYMQELSSKGALAPAQALPITDAVNLLPQSGAILVGDAVSRYQERLPAEHPHTLLSISEPAARHANPQLLAKVVAERLAAGDIPPRPQLLYVKPLTYQKLAEQGSHGRPNN